MNNKLRNIFIEKILQYYIDIFIVFDFQVYCFFKVKQDLILILMFVIKSFFFFMKIVGYFLFDLFLFC